MDSKNTAAVLRAHEMRQKLIDSRWVLVCSCLEWVTDFEFDARAEEQIEAHRAHVVAMLVADGPVEVFAVGQKLHGFCGGAFGRDSYACRTVESVGVDWVVTRNTRGEVEFATKSRLANCNTDDTSYCDGYEGCGADGDEGW